MAKKKQGDVGLRNLCKTKVAELKLVRVASLDKYVTGFDVPMESMEGAVNVTHCQSHLADHPLLHLDENKINDEKTNGGEKEIVSTSAPLGAWPPFILFM